MPKPLILLSETTLEEIHQKCKVQSLRKVIDEGNYGVSAPTMYKLVYAYRRLKNGDLAIREQLFPEWVQNEPAIQKQDPDIWTYRGRFPDGKWLKYDRDIPRYGSKQ